LHASVRELDEVLLQRINAESVLYLEHGNFAVGAIRLDQEFPVLAEETECTP